MRRRDFLLSTTAAAPFAALAASTTKPTVLYGDNAVTLDTVRPDPKDLWIQGAQLKSINGFELKPQGACREDVCIPVGKDLRRGQFFNLSGFARKVRQTVVTDASTGVWSFGEIPLVTSAFVNSRMAPDFAVPDRKGRIVHLSDFKGKKVLIVTWASW